MAYLYVIHAKGTPLHKIGVTTRTPHERLKELQTSSPHELEMFHFVKTDVASELERELHEEYRESQSSGEWFRIPDRQLKYLKTSINSKVKRNLLVRARTLLGRAANLSNVDSQSLLLKIGGQAITANNTHDIAENLNALLHCSISDEKKEAIESKLNQEENNTPF